MAEGEHHDYLDWTSFPSSYVKEWPRTAPHHTWMFGPVTFSVSEGDIIMAEMKAKTSGVDPDCPSELHLVWAEKTREEGWGEADSHVPELYGYEEWTKVVATSKKKHPDGLPSWAHHGWLRVMIGAAKTKEEPAVMKIDDLKIYRNGNPVYSNDFSNWTPYIVSGAIVGGATITKALNWW